MSYDETEQQPTNRLKPSEESILGRLAMTLAAGFGPFRRKHAAQLIIEQSVLHFDPRRCRSVTFKPTKIQPNRPLGHKRRMRARQQAV